MEDAQRRQFADFVASSGGSYDDFLGVYWQRRIALARALDEGRIAMDVFLAGREAQDRLLVETVEAQVAQARAPNAATEARAEAQRQRSALDLGMQLLMPPAAPPPPVNCITQRAGGALFTTCR